MGAVSVDLTRLLLAATVGNKLRMAAEQVVPDQSPNSDADSMLSSGEESENEVLDLHIDRSRSPASSPSPPPRRAPSLISSDPKRTTFKKSLMKRYCKFVVFIMAHCIP